VVTASAGALLSVVAAMAAPAAFASGPDSPAAVAASLGANDVPAETVVLVDISASMTSDGLYAKVQRVLPRFLGNLRKQDPHDLAAVVVFGAPQDTQTVYLGRPTANVPLPATAESGATDFGYAFQKALGILSQAPPRIKVGGVLLLSDGELDAPGDPQYATYSSPGWEQLRTQAQGLGMTVTGYGLPLTSNPVFSNSVNTALGQVFAQRQTLSPEMGNLGQELSLARQGVMKSRVATVVQPDIGRGAQVTWVRLPGSDGAPPLNLGAGHANAEVRVTSLTSHVPLDVTGLSVTSSGFGVRITGALPAGTHQLAPGQSVSLPVHLTWPKASGGWSLFGGSRIVTGQLTLTGQVASPFSRAIEDAFGDRSFRIGGLAGETSARAVAVAPGQFAIVVWAIIIAVIIAVIAAAIAALMMWRARLEGRLILNPPDQHPRDLYLPNRPWMAWPTEDLIQIPGQITVRRLHGTKMRITLQLNDSTEKGVLEPGGRTWIAGIVIDHRSAQEAASDGRPRLRQGRR
jgi:hypothetical protein